MTLNQKMTFYKKCPVARHDMYLINNYRGFESWIGYPLGWRKKQIAGYNFGNEYYPTRNRRHTITAIQDYKLSKKWRLNFAFKFGSGQPYIEVTARKAVMDAAGRIHYEMLDGEKNFYQLPDYHRLDIGLFYSTKIFLMPTEFFIQAVNVYNRKNVWFRTWKSWENLAVVEDYTMLSFLPTG